MSEDIHEGSILITSYAGPANTSEPTRSRLQFGVMNSHESVGYTEVVEIRNALTRWIEERKPVHVVTVQSVLVAEGWIGSSRYAACVCGWRGPERATTEMVFDDALEHEKSAAG